MQHHYFKTLAENPGYRNILLNATFIGERRIEQVPVLLFQTGKVYIEVAFSSNGDRIISSNSFTDVDLLEPYLAAIPLPSFLDS